MKFPAAAALLAAAVGAFAQEPAGVIAGTVRCALSRRALPSTRIELTLNPSSDDGQTTALHAAADIRGGFRFTGLPAGEVVLSFSKTGYEAGGRRTLQISLETDHDAKRLDVRLRPSAAVSGKILDSDGDPVTGAAVQLQTTVLRAGVKSRRAVRTTRTDDRGHYRLFDLAPGRYYLSVSPARGVAAAGIREFAHSWGYFPGAPTPREAERIALAWGSERGGVDFQLAAPPQTAIGGLVLGIGGRAPCVSCPLSIIRRGEGQIAAVTTDEAGRFLVRGLPAGGYVLRANALEGPRFTALRRVSLVEREFVRADMTLQPGSVVRGRAAVSRHDRASAAAGGTGPLTLTLTAVDGSASRRLRAMPVLAAGGEFAIIDVGPGEYRIGIEGGPAGGYLREVRIGGRPLPAPRITVSGGADLNGLRVVLGADGAVVRGKVEGAEFAAEGEAAPAGFAVLMPAEGIGGYRREYLGDYRPGDGLFAITGAPPGRYHVFAVPRGEPWDLTDPLDLGRLRGAGKAVRLRAGEEAAVDAPYVAAPR